MPLIPEKIERRNESMTCQLNDKYKGENYTVPDGRLIV
jgi:hypothetical protein